MPEITTLHVQPEGKPKTASIYEVGVQELHRVTHDEALRRQVDTDLNEARGRDGARLHVTLRALAEIDRRAEETLLDISKRLEERVTQIERRLEEQAQRAKEDLSRELQETRVGVSNQAEAGLQSITSHMQESTDRLAVDVRKLRDEVVSLVDSRMNQADASFAALRGDVEVVKFLVMDLIKDRIGRTDPKSKSF